jgi:hypothetical protein
VYVGAQVAVTVTYKNKLTGALTDPTTASVITRSPSGTETTYTYPTDSEYAKTSTGIYVLTVVLDASGQWWFRGKADGALVGANETSQAVSPSHFTTP